MKKFKQYLDEKGRCWTGYKPVPGKKAFSKDSCVKEDKTDALAKKHNFHMELSKSAPTEHLKKQHNKKAYEYLQKMADIKGMKIPPLKEDGAMGGSAGPTNAVGGGAIAGTGGKGGEPGVYLKKKKDNTPIIMNMARRKAPQ